MVQPHWTFVAVLYKSLQTKAIPLSDGHGWVAGLAKGPTSFLERANMVERRGLAHHHGAAHVVGGNLQQ